MIRKTKPIKQYKLNAVRSGQTDVTPLRQVVEAAVKKTAGDDKVRVLYVKSTRPSAEQSPQAFLTTKFDSEREDDTVRSTGSLKVAQGQHKKATELVSALVEPLQDLPDTSHAVKQASRSVSALCANNDTQLFGLSCTPELLDQLKQIEDGQQSRRAAQRPPHPPQQASSAIRVSPKPLPIPPLKLSPEGRSASVSFAAPVNLLSGAHTDRPRPGVEPTIATNAAVSMPNTPLQSETSTEESSARSSPDRMKETKARSARRPLVQQGTRGDIKNPRTTRHIPNPYEQTEQRIASLQDLFFPDTGSPKPVRPGGHPVRSDNKPIGSSRTVPSSPDISTAAKPGTTTALHELHPVLKQRREERAQRRTQATTTADAAPPEPQGDALQEAPTDQPPQTDTQ